ncbi:GNAT family N-acetyltransferase [Streptomyces sp. cmx-4-9]|uniref:GNAT family N-acetyltransferase n=1 Tax=Streptomyces sp. cmx-4-9 TaxID=2790941 RepID=UPI00397EA948
MTDQPALTLRPFHPSEDTPLLRTWVTSRTALLTWAGPSFSWPLDDAELTAYAAEPGRRTWTAVSPGAGPVGHCSFLGTRLGRVLIAPAARGRGLGRHLVSLAVERGFGELALPEISLGVWAHNTAALRIYEKLGFQTVQVVEDVEEVDGTPWSAVQMTLRSLHG